MKWFERKTAGGDTPGGNSTLYLESLFNLGIIPSKSTILKNGSLMSFGLEKFPEIILSATSESQHNEASSLFSVSFFSS